RVEMGPWQRRRKRCGLYCGVVESVDGAPALAAGQGIMLPGGSQNPPERCKNRTRLSIFPVIEMQEAGILEV
ncbi:hypothetical protein, partial [Xanthomonas oryzae]|uniref:hypothetical protein n=1 Tax=Xanthomonas oryzae TaxID=347 RepID=UPI003CCFE9AF